jgi:hypothetical protein
MNPKWPKRASRKRKRKVQGTPIRENLPRDRVPRDQLFLCLTSRWKFSGIKIIAANYIA